MIRKQTKVWKTKDGRKLRLCDMSEAHLRSVLKIFKKAFTSRQLNLMRFSPNLQGEMAQYCAEQEVWAGLEQTIEEVFPIVENVQLELHRRQVLSNKKLVE